LVKAADYGLESQRLDTIVAAAQGYFDLAKAQSAVGVAKEAVAISTNYQDQVQEAVSAGIAFKGDLFRVQVQTERNLLSLRQAQEQGRVAAARLAQTLQLDSTVELMPRENELFPLSLLDTNASLDSLVVQGLGARPELKQSRAFIEAARQARAGAIYGPLIPTLGAQVFAGGLGGGRDGTPRAFGETEDYEFTLGWRIGPGGLLDRGRIHATESRLRIARLSDQKARDAVTRQIVESLARVQSLRDQIATAHRALQAADETLRLTRQRKEFGVGAVLENIQAEQDLTGSRLEYLNTIAEYNKAKYRLNQALGGGAAWGNQPP
jgi:outer membrane protein TolC